jgi:hypothetical protein
VAGDHVGVGAAGHQGPCGLAVQALALGARELLLDRGRDEPVRQPLAVGPDQAGGQQRVARRGQLADRHTGDGGDDVRGRAIADDGERGGDRPVARGQRRQPPADDVARDRRDRRRVVGARVDRLGAVRGDLAAELAQEPGVAVDGAMALAAHGRRRVGREAADEPRGAAGREPLRVQDDRRAHAAEQAEEVGGRARILGPRADGDEQRQVVDAPREVGEHLQRGAVGPLRVVDHEGQRPPLGQRRAQPQHAVRHQHRRVRAGGAALEQQRARRRCRPVEQLGALGLGGVAQRRLEQRTHDAEGEVALERPRRGAPDETAAVGGEQRGAIEQGGLPQPRGRVEDDDPAVAAHEAAHRPGEHLELHGPLDERGVVRGRRRLRCDDVEMGHRAATLGTDHVGCDAPIPKTFPTICRIA